MKLRNKKTGEIMDDVQYRNYSLSDGFGFRMNGKEWEYHSLAELCEEWEDYEEPKDYWWIHSCGDILHDYFGNCSDKQRKQIGNYFETKEEAEKAVEKLKALKRLKDKGLELDGWKTWEAVTGKCCMSNTAAHSYYAHFTFRSTDELEKDEIVRKDLDLLFGGENE